MKDREQIQRQLGPSPSSLYEVFRRAFEEERLERETEQPLQDTMKLLRERTTIKNLCT